MNSYQNYNGNRKYKDEEDEDLGCNDFDEVLEVTGSQGKFQKLLLYAAVCPITAIEPFITLNTIFLLFQPDHWCYVPGRLNTTSLETWKTLHIPRDFDRPIGPDGSYQFSHCTMYNENGTISKCNMGWEYDKSEYDSTISSTYHWVCNNDEYPTNSFTAQALGNAVGTMIFGHMADKIGRKPIFFLTILINVVFRFFSFFIAHSVELFYIMQFIVGTAFPVMFIAPSMIVAEICDKDYRGWVYALTWMIWVVGMALLPLIVYVCRQWFLIGVVTTLPGAFLLLYWFQMPESPRWLFSVRKLEQCSIILMQIAKVNGKEKNLTKSQLDKTLKRLYNVQAKGRGSNGNTTTGVWTLFSKKRLAKNTLLLTTCWSINIVVYYCITLNSTHMTGNQFVNFFLLSVVELPSGMCGAYLVDKVGRRWTQVVFFFGCTFSCIAAAVVVPNQMLEIISVVLAKFSVTLTFLVVYLQGAEIFPTQLRSTGSGFSSTVGAAFGIFCPIMVALGTHEMSLPYWIMSFLSFMGMICAAFLPETLDQTLPETIDDANNFGKGNKFWSLHPKAELPASAGRKKITLEGLDDNVDESMVTVNHVNNQIDLPKQ